MPKNLDTRDFSFSRPSANFAATAEAISLTLPGSHAVSADRINPFTGSAENLNSVNAAEAFSPVPGLGPAKEDLVARALEHVQAAAAALGFSGPGEQPEFVPDPHVKRTTTGESVVNLRQQYRGVPVFQMERAVLFDQNGAIQAVTGDSVGLPADLDTLPAVTVERAALAAARHVAQGDTREDSWTREAIQEPSVDIDDYAPRVLGRLPLPSQPCVLDKGPFGDYVPAQLVVDGMKMTSANPSFLVARDSILRALEGQRTSGKLTPDDHKKALRVLWLAFARFGMGPKARSVGASLVGIVEDRNPPSGI